MSNINYITYPLNQQLSDIATSSTITMGFYGGNGIEKPCRITALSDYAIPLDLRHIPYLNNPYNPAVEQVSVLPDAIFDKLLNIVKEKSDRKHNSTRKHKISSNRKTRK
jgi:hypothetical protein